MKIRFKYLYITHICLHNLHIWSIFLCSTLKCKVRKRSLFTGSNVNAKYVTSSRRYHTNNAVTTSWSVLKYTTEMLQVLKAQVQVQVLETNCQVQPKYPGTRTHQMSNGR